MFDVVGIYFAENSSKSNQYVYGIGGGTGCPVHKDRSCYICHRLVLMGCAWSHVLVLQTIRPLEWFKIHTHSVRIVNIHSQRDQSVLFWMVKRIHFGCHNCRTDI